ncbi:MAG: helix-turn-helix domain-containing protein [Cyclobacteriaceae bacterium]
MANSLLALNLVGISLSAFTVSMVESGLILQVPHYYRLPSPIVYAMFPAVYLYVKLILTDRNHLEKKEYLHFLPALVHLIEMTPFYLSSTEVKLQVIQMAMSQRINLYAASEGWLPAYVHNIIRGFLAILYAVVMWKLIRKTVQSNNVILLYSRTVIKWLKAFTLINASLGIALVVCLIVIAIPADIRSFILHAVLSIGVLVPNFYLFFRPEILYGVPQPIVAVEKDLTDAPVDSGKMVAEPIGTNLDSTRNEIPSFIYRYKTQVNQYLTESGRFIEPDFLLQDLSRDTGIPMNHLQFLIHKVEGRKFTEFINGYRIQHMKDQIDKGAIKSKTLEGLAMESGFSSKTTFNRTIKRLTGKTPKEYFIHGKGLRQEEALD